MTGQRAQRLPEGEYLVVSAARALVSPTHAGALELMARPRPRGELPERLSPTAMGLLRQTLARGCARALLLRGGWRREVSLDGRGGVRRGRLWERWTALPPLRFGALSLQLCRWLAGGARQAAKILEPGQREVGDELLLAFAFELVGDGQPSTDLAAAAAARGAPLAWLFAPWPLSLAGPCELEASSFGALTSGAGACVLEALLPELAQRWASLEQLKPTVRAPATLCTVGSAQEKVIAGLLEALEAAHRRDLATFLVDAGVAVLSTLPSARSLAERYAANLDRQSSLSSRQEALHQAGALLRALDRLRSWNEEHRYVRAFDDEYAEAQALLARWEELGVTGFERARAVYGELERLDSTAAS